MWSADHQANPLENTNFQRRLVAGIVPVTVWLPSQMTPLRGTVDRDLNTNAPKVAHEQDQERSLRTKWQPPFINSLAPARQIARRPAVPANREWAMAPHG
ncbi:hypothetical protein AM571_PB00001 (plasmid) [Rhizobium etli 8C-3]|uniref:Uncharacterized protein n=1 Tax=Rhizobium etli 8C-3 TaxID=538025 RepID=A0A1L5PAW9_RHIET|nr:hypothetical protein AM571_PB00001 [Rhizobium etli 8C-3]